MVRKADIMDWLSLKDRKGLYAFIGILSIVALLCGLRYSLILFFVRIILGLIAIGYLHVTLNIDLKREILPIHTYIVYYIICIAPLIFLIALPALRILNDFITYESICNLVVLVADIIRHEKIR